MLFLSHLIFISVYTLPGCVPYFKGVNDWNYLKEVCFRSFKDTNSPNLSSVLLMQTSVPASYKLQGLNIKFLCELWEKVQTSFHMTLQKVFLFITKPNICSGVYSALINFNHATRSNVCRDSSHANTREVIQYFSMNSGYLPYSVLAITRDLVLRR